MEVNNESPYNESDMRDTCSENISCYFISFTSQGHSYEIIISSVVMGTVLPAKVVAEYSTRMFLAMVQVPRPESVFGNNV